MVSLLDGHFSTVSCQASTDSHPHSRPVLRDRIITDPESYPFDNFFLPYTTTLSLNWPHNPDTCIVHKRDRQPTKNGDITADSVGDVNDDDGVTNGDDDSAAAGLMLNPDFKAHILNIDNWSLGPAFANTFPDLVKEGGPRISDAASAASAPWG